MKKLLSVLVLVFFVLVPLIAYADRYVSVVQFESGGAPDTGVTIPINIQTRDIIIRNVDAADEMLVTINGSDTFPLLANNTYTASEISVVTLFLDANVGETADYEVIITGWPK